MKAKILGMIMLSMLIIALTWSVLFNTGCDKPFSLALTTFAVAWYFAGIMTIIKGDKKVE